MMKTKVRTESMLFGWLVISMPLSVISVSPFIATINRLIFVFLGIFLFLRSLGEKHPQRLLSVPYLIIVFVFFGILWGVRHINLSADLIEYFANLCTLIAGAAILGSNRLLVCQRTGSIISYALIFYSLDVILQSFWGANIFGIYPAIDGRYWGMFFSGAPSFGVFAGILFFGATFYLRGNYFLHGIIVLALFLANDRGAILSWLWSILVYALFFRKKLIDFFLAFVVIAAFILTFVYAPWLLPSRILIFFESLIAFWNPSLDALSFFGLYDLPPEASIFAYVQKYQLILTRWFDCGNALNALFGTGWGLTHEKLAEITGVGRPHNVLLELVLAYGIFTIILFWKFFTVLREYRHFSVIIITFTSPFMFYSAYSFNFFILFVLVFSIMRERSITLSLTNVDTPVKSAREKFPNPMFVQR